MHRAHSKYPIGKIIIELLRESSRNQTGFIAKLGYRNTSKGTRRLQRWLEGGADCHFIESSGHYGFIDGSGDYGFIERLIEVFPSRKAELLESVEKTKIIKKEEMEAEVRRRFKPCIWAESTYRPTSFLSYWGAAVANKIKLPDKSITKGEIRRLINEHYAHRGGEIFRYRYEPKYELSEHYDVTGKKL